MHERSKLMATEDKRWELSKSKIEVSPEIWVPKHKMGTGFEDKTRWDRLNLFGTVAIPIVVVLATIMFGLLQIHLADLQHASDQQIAQKQHDSDQQIALEQQHAAILQTYIDNIQDLLLNHNLLKSSSFDNKNPYYDIAVLARARTLTALHGLYPDRKGNLLTFLYEARLIGFTELNFVYLINIFKLGESNPSSASFSIFKYLENPSTCSWRSGCVNESNPIFYLNEADFSNVNLQGLQGYSLWGVDLSGANLSGALLNDIGFVGANLSSTNLDGTKLGNALFIGANLSFASLTGADLSSAFFNNADLRYAIFSNAKLNYANLKGAYLRNADFSGADLSGTDLSGADLSDANLRGAVVTNKQLALVKSLNGTIMPDGSKHP
jgi:hypothetical protein